MFLPLMSTTAIKFYNIIFFYPCRDRDLILVYFEWIKMEFRCIRILKRDAICGFVGLEDGS